MRPLGNIANIALWLSLIFVVILIGTDSIASTTRDLSQKIRLPAGFSIHLYADNISNARSLALSPDGTVFIGTRREGSVYAVKDLDGDHRADRVYMIAEGLNMPNGVAFRDDTLYIAEVNRLLRFDKSDSRWLTGA